MQIPLDQFEQYITESILKRGLSYFKNGHVNEPDEINPGKYEFIVEGSENYTLQLTLKHGIITEYMCNCPYDLGPVCKHVAAAIFYMQQNVLELTEMPKAEKKRATNKPTPSKPIAQQINELLEKATHDDLKQFIKENAVANPSFRNLFFSAFAQYNNHESKEWYIKQIKSIIKTVADRDGFIDWSASKIVGKTIANLVETAQKQFNNRNYKSAILICTAIMEQMTEALESADDSNGSIGGCIYTAYEILYSIIREQPSKEINKIVFDYCCMAFEKRIYSGWDWHIGMLRLAALLVTTAEETERIFTLIDQTKASEYEIEEAQCIKYNILLETQGENEASIYLEQNITNSKLRRAAIEKAMREGNYKKAIEIAKDGIQHDLKNKPGLAKEWYDWLLNIAQAENDTKKIIEYARLLFIDNFRKKQDYYQVLKQHVKPKEWVAFVEGMIKDISTKKRWSDSSLIASIYIKEQWWSRLFELVKKTPELNIIEQYEKYLAKDYSKEMVDLYTNGIVNYLKNNLGRDHYQNSCRYIRKIIKLGAKEKATEIIMNLKTEYPKRKALIEELNKV